MRTTLTLEPDVAQLLEQEVHRLRKPLKDVVNQALRRGLTGGAGGRRPPRYRAKVHRARLQPGIDPRSLNRLADELEDQRLVSRAPR